MTVSVIISITTFVFLPCMLTDLVQKMNTSRFLIAVIRTFIGLTLFVKCVFLVSEVGSVREAFVCRNTRRGYVGYIRRNLPLAMRGILGDSELRGHYKADFLFLIVLMDVILRFVFITIPFC